MASIPSESRLGEQISTSHRMLLYHFGSRTGLLAAVVDYVEVAQREHLSSLLADRTTLTGDPVEHGLRFWRSVTDAALIYGPLFFELSSHAMQDHPHPGGLGDDMGTPWINAQSAAWTALGYPPEAARTQARLDLAVARGLLHDLLLTGDRAGIDAAMRIYATLVFTAHLSTPKSSGGRLLLLNAIGWRIASATINRERLITGTS